ncbi:hypothetical protein [Tenacibaculum holothuriorum]|uniref:hypothetical protein n=1 Tax=Tenacibaculum holothuriorum TaxID=1635173 RepID=UPI001E5985EC|nr:hypothetical protein [Tenacibaculum holothuriorum]
MAPYLNQLSAGKSGLPFGKGFPENGLSAPSGCPPVSNCIEKEMTNCAPLGQYDSVVVSVFIFFVFSVAFDFEFCPDTFNVISRTAIVIVFISFILFEF